MAITITTAIAANVAAFAPVTLAGTTTRNPFTAGARLSQTVTSIVEGDSGRLEIGMSSNTGFEVGDSILWSGGTGDFAQFNGRHDVAIVGGSNTITVSTTYAAASTGTKGTIYRMNDNLLIKIMVYNAAQTTLYGVQHAYVDPATGAWTMDLQGLMQSQLTSVFRLTTGEMNTAGCSHTYDVKVYESFQSADYSIELIEDTSGEQTTIAHRTTEYAAARVSGALMNTGNYTAYDKLVILFQTDKTSGVRVVWTRVTLTGLATLNTTYSFASIINGWAGTVIPFDAGVYDYHTISIQWNNGTSYETIKTAITIKAAKLCSTTLHYLNRLGGYEQVEFHDYQDQQDAEKIERYTGRTFLVRTLQAVPYPGSTGQVIRDLITSPEVYDTTGAAVEVLTDSLQYKAREVEPEIQIRYEENFINT